MRILVLGANGPSGRAVVKIALDRGHHVAALTRHPESFPLSHERLDVVAGDATDPATIDRAVDRCDAVVSAIGTPYTREPVSLYSSSGRLLVEAMARHGGRRLLVVTSAAVAPRESGNSGLVGKVLEPVLRNVVGKTLYDDMDRLETIVKASDLDWTIVRPPALTDAPPTGWVVTPSGGKTATFLAHEDLAAFILDQIGSTEYVRRAVTVSSPQADASLVKTLRRGLSG